MPEGMSGLKPWEPKELGPRHRHMVVLSAAGMRNKEIAEMFSMSQSRVSVILNDPRAQALRDGLLEELTGQLAESAQDILASAQADAARTMVHLARHAESENVRRMSAGDILDRTGHAPKAGRTQESTHIDEDVARMLVEGMKEANAEQKELTFVQDSAGVFRQEEDLFD